MIDTYYIPQKTKAADPKTGLERAVRQAVQEAVQSRLASINNYGGQVNLHVTVHICCCHHPVHPKL